MMEESETGRRRADPKIMVDLGKGRKRTESAEEEADRLADQARRAAASRKQLEDEQAEFERVNAIDLLTDPTHNIKDLHCAAWQILVEVRRPKPTMGLLVKTAQQRMAEEHLVVIGKVLKCGPTALEGKTSSGVELSRIASPELGINTPADLVGWHIIHQRYTGNVIPFPELPGKKLLFLTATEVLGLTRDPARFMME